MFHHHSPMPRHGGFYLLHPADTRAYMTNVRQALEQQEAFQLWCQLQVAKLHHCLEALDQLGATSEQGHIDCTGDTTSNLPITMTGQRHNQLHQLRAAITDTIRILRQQRFAHLHNEQFLRTRQLLQQDFQQRLTTRDMECHEIPPRTRSAPAQPRWRSYVRTAMPYDLLMWQRNQFPQFDPESDSEWEKTSSLFDRFPQFHVQSEQFLHTTFRIEPQPFLRESDSRNDSSSTQLCQLRMGYTFGCSIELSLPWSRTMAGSQRCPFLQSWQPLYPSPLGLLPHAQEQTDHRRLSSETNEILEGYGRHNEPIRIRVVGVHTTSTSRKQSGHSDKSPFQQGFSQYGSPQRSTRSITRLPTSKTPERPTPPDLSC